MTAEWVHPHDRIEGNSQRPNVQTPKMTQTINLMSPFRCRPNSGVGNEAPLGFGPLAFAISTRGVA